jgi:formylglycine-generating enzyme required for sulfatase activity
MLRGAVLFFLAALVFSLGARAELNCEDIFKTSLTTRPTETQVDQAIRNLAALRLNVDLAQAQGTSGPKTNSLRLAYTEKESLLVRYLETNKIMSREELVTRVRDSIRQNQISASRVLQDEQDQKIERQKDLEEAIRLEKKKVLFYEIEPGSFQQHHRRSRRTYTVAVSTPFEMAAIQTTQIVWRKVVKAIQKKYPPQLWPFGWSFIPGKYGALKLNPSNFVGDDHPVENVSYNDVQLWLAALNELAADGHPVVKEVIVGHNHGDIYRLPSTKEWTFVARGRGAVGTLYSSGNSFNTQDGWVLENSDGTTHPVATKNPFIFEGKEIFDLQGNVSEMTSDIQGPNLAGADHSNQIVRGGSYAGKPLSIHHEESLKPGARRAWVGFRLVRSAP